MNHPEVTQKSNFTFALALILIVGLMLLVGVIVLKDHINLALVEPSEAAVLSDTDPVNDDSVTPANDYVQTLLDHPENFRVEENPDQLPAAALLEQKQIKFLIGL